MTTASSSLTRSPAVDFGSAQQMRVLCDKLQKRSTFIGAAALLASWAKLDDFEIARCGRKILICYSMAHRYLRGEDIDLSPVVGCLECVYSHKRVYFDLLWILYLRRHIFDVDQRDRLSLLLTPFVVTGPVGLPRRQPRCTSGYWDIDARDTSAVPPKAAYRLISRPKRHSAGPAAVNKPPKPAPSALSATPPPPPKPSPSTPPAPSASEQPSHPRPPSYMQRLVKLLSPKSEGSTNGPKSEGPKPKSPTNGTPAHPRRRGKHRRSGAVSLSESNQSSRYNPLSTAGRGVLHSPDRRMHSPDRDMRPRRNALFDFGADGTKAGESEGQGETTQHRGDDEEDEDGDNGDKGGINGDKNGEDDVAWRPRPQRFGIFCTGKGSHGKAPRSQRLVGER